jgi:aminopeptidase N
MSGKATRRKTASELMAEHEADPEYVAERQRREQERRRKLAELREAEAPLIEDLRRVGIDVDSAWDLVNRSTPYPSALPILVAHLERGYPPRVREGIARALAVRDARFAWGTLVRLYREEEAGTDAKAGLAVALAAAADGDVLDEVIALARDSRHGQSRVLLLAALRRLRAQAALQELADDPVMGQEARRLLRGAR